MKPRNISRRAFLLAAGSAATVLASPTILRATSPSVQGGAPGGVSDAEWTFIQPRPVKLDLWGRITDYGVPIRDVAGGEGKVTGYLPINTVVPVFEIIHATPPASNPHNDVYYRTEVGYLYTNSVQLMKPYRMPVEVTQIDTQIDGQQGFWAEVIVPFTVARNVPGGVPMVTEDGEAVVLTYGSTYRVIDIQTDDGGFLWYKLDDDRKAAPSYYALARHLRRISAEDLAPISPGAEKRIVVSLTDQRMQCFENGSVVLDTLVSTGAGGFGTPVGEHAVVYKQVSRHMFSDPENEAFSDPNFFDLPGVPFNVFLTTLGHAIHGTYWHGDFGRARSHGCINVTPEIARFIYRWVDPAATYDSLASGSSKEPGTAIIVE
jgi:L,D-transpeptidase-like protein